MKKLLAILIFSCLGALVNGPAWVAEEGPSPNEALLKTLAINRSLLAEYELELMKLKQDSAARMTDALARQLENSRYKIKALSEESKKLRAALTAREEAQEFIKDLLLKTTVEQVAKRRIAPPPRRVSPPAIATALAAPSPSPAPISVDRPAPKQPPLPPPVAETPDRMHERALRLVAEQKLDKAVKIYEDLVLSNPDDDQAYVIMGHCYLLSGRYEKAEQAFQNAVHIDPQNAEEITPFYQNIVFRNPDDDRAHGNLGYAYLIIGDVLKAQEAYRDALAINPKNERALEGMRLIAELKSDSPGNQ
ncbi:MAG: tetratricopeptide repeat protein [Candidatus Omnitrophica bacterium]|nr:tetratricopeptide repeat protein [Candidatus Omnitrophota bacterium]